MRLPHRLDALFKEWERSAIDSNQRPNVGCAFHSPEGVLIRGRRFMVIMRVSYDHTIYYCSLRLGRGEDTELRWGGLPQMRVNPPPPPPSSYRREPEEEDSSSSEEEDQEPGRYILKRMDGEVVPLPRAFDRTFFEWDRAAIAEGPSREIKFDSQNQYILDQPFSVVIYTTPEGTIDHRFVALDGGEPAELLAI